MEAPEMSAAVDAAVSTASSLGVPVDDAVVLHNSNKVTLRLVPADVVARVARVGEEVAHLEIDVACRLAASDSPVAALERRVEPRVYENDGFAITFWNYYEQRPGAEVVPAEYANALARLHGGMRALDLATPHFTDRVAEADAIIADVDGSVALADADRALLGEVLRTQRRAIEARGAPEQLLHGEPHTGNVLATPTGPRFIDFETCCRGPVEFDLAHAPEAVSACYSEADQQLVEECRLLVLAMVAAWRCEANDQLPNGDEARRRIITALHAGPPWPTVNAVTP
jgi:hypothetical protein